MITGDRYTYGTLIAKFMGNRINAQEEKELDEWICMDDDNMKLFEDLTNDFHARWAKQWFKEAGVKTPSIKWRDRSGWYRPDPNPRRGFYIVTGITAAVMIILYIVFKYFLKP
ncbi:MAG: hypothetical protein ABI687_04820 [Flavitalea sp.]